MQENNLNFDEEIPFEQFKVSRRRKLLPWWVLTFTWLFLIFLFVVPIAVIMAVLKHSFQISLLGFATDNPLSLTGVFLILLYAFKGMVAIGLWTEKDWAVKLAKIDAVLSICLCCLSMLLPFITPTAFVFSFRLELIAIIPYLYKMRQIEYDWDNFNYQVQQEEMQLPA